MRTAIRWLARGLGGTAAVLLVRLLLGALLGLARPAPEPPDPALAARASRIHADALLLDGHNDVATWMLRYGFDLGMDGDDPAGRNPFYFYPFEGALLEPAGDSIWTHTDLARLREGGVDAQFFSIFVSCAVVGEGQGAAGRRAREMIEVFLAQVERHRAEIELARSVADVVRIRRSGRVAALMGLEGGHMVDDVRDLAEFHRLGVRYVTLTHNCTNDWGDSVADDGDPEVVRHGGLSDRGRALVREMNRLGLIVDVSHASDETFNDAIATSRAPVLASHSSVRAIAGHPRNLSDEMLRALARNGGVAMVNFVARQLDPTKVAGWKLFTGWHWLTHPGGGETPLGAVVDHIEHVIRVAGVDHVGLGSDFDGAMFMPEGLSDVGDFPNLTLELVGRGHGDDVVVKVLGGNALRVLAEVEQAAGTVAE